jgi:hypothetical protein
LISERCRQISAWSRRQVDQGRSHFAGNVQAGTRLVISNDPSFSTVSLIPVCCATTRTEADAAEAACNGGQDSSAIAEMRMRCSASYE